MVYSEPKSARDTAGAAVARDFPTAPNRANLTLAELADAYMAAFVGRDTTQPYDVAFWVRARYWLRLVIRGDRHHHASGHAGFPFDGALAQFERSLIAERTAAGRAAAKRRGVRFGRPRRLTDQQITHAARLAGEGTAVPEITHLLGVSRATAYRVLARKGA